MVDANIVIVDRYARGLAAAGGLASGTIRVSGDRDYGQ